MALVTSYRGFTNKLLVPILSSFDIIANVTALLFCSFVICFAIADSASATILICVFALGLLDACSSAGGEVWRWAQGQGQGL